jgi:hypothetical protein
MLTKISKNLGGAAYDIILARSQDPGKIRLLQEGVEHG